jgi:hypothetical protein
VIQQIKQDLDPIGRTQARVVGIVGTICLVETRKNLSADFHGSQSSMARIAAPFPVEMRWILAAYDASLSLFNLNQSASAARTSDGFCA